ncbi:MAG: ASCH domain-containing protein [Kineosporiaceae bacterium]
MSTPLPPPDEGAAEEFWARYLAAAGGPPSGRWQDLVQFGDSVELAEELVGLVLHGPKRATAGSVAEYEAEGVPLPVAGDRWIACDGRGRPRAVLRTTDVRVGPLSSVDDAFAWDEGEGDRTRADWLRGHEAYFRRVLPGLGVAFRDDLPVVFERFEVLYAEE